MIILLSTLFIIAIVITFAGILLSPRHPQAAPPPKVPSYTRGTDRRQEYGYAASNVRNRRSTAYVRPAAYTSRANAFSFSNIKNLIIPGRRSDRPTPWIGIIVIFAAIFGIGLVVMQSFLPNTNLVASAAWINPIAPPAATSAPAPVAKVHTVDLFNSLAGASKALVRIGQLNPDQYASTDEFNTWGYAACSAASMTEVINAYGHNYRLTDILHKESSIHEITPDEGLLEPKGIDYTVALFGFKTVPIAQNSLDDVIKVANQGRPVIVSFPPSRWEGGHILIVRGGNADSVYLADSSRLNMNVMTHDKFLHYWGGFAVVVVPNNA